MGMSKMLAMRRIIMPRLFKELFLLGNSLLSASSSLVAYLGVPEIYGTALYEQAANYNPFETYLVAGMYYLVLVIFFTYLVNKLEIRLKVEDEVSVG